MSGLEHVYIKSNFKKTSKNRQKYYFTVKDNSLTIVKGIN